MKKYIPLNSLLSEYSERNSENLYKPVAVGRYGIRTRESIYSKELAKDYSKNKLIFNNTLTVGMGSVQMDIGILSDDVTYSVSPAYHTYKINGINPNYLRYCLECRNQDMFSQFVKRGSRQGKSIDLKRWLTYEIPVYHEDAQQEIVDKLDKVSDMISIQQQQLELFDELVKTRFIELFGDPIHNEKGWERKPLSTVCKSIVDCPHSTPSYTFENTGYMCVRTSIVKKNKILWDEIEYIPEDEFYKRIQRKKPEKGDVIYTREGGILGIAAVIDRECDVALGQRMMLLSPDTAQCTSHFLSVAMNCKTFLDNALKGIIGSASPHINVGDIKAFEMILPPIDMQMQFSKFVEKTNESKKAVQNSIAELEELKKSLMQKYFG